MWQQCAFFLEHPRDCAELYMFRIATTDGVYTVYAGAEHTPVQVYCDMTTDGGGWTVCFYCHSSSEVQTGETHFQAAARNQKDMSSKDS